MKSLLPKCHIPDDCIDSKRYSLFMARAVLQELLGPIENPPLMLQSRHGKKSIERQAVGTDGTALPGQAWRCRAKKRGQALVCRGHAVDRAHRQPLARFA